MTEHHHLLPKIVVILRIRVKIIIKSTVGEGPVRSRAGLLLDSSAPCTR